jgi:hypothetical protein
VLPGKLEKDISFALRRGTIAQVTTALDAGQRAAKDELALNMAGWDRTRSCCCCLSCGELRADKLLSLSSHVLARHGSANDEPADQREPDFSEPKPHNDEPEHGDLT